jgi:hypothetical protein
MTCRRIAGVVGCGALLLCASLMMAQSSAGILTGVIRDPSRAPIAGATVHVRSTATNAVRETSTDPTGGFRIINLAPGGYELTVMKEGFRTVREAEVRIDLNRTVSLALQLDVGPVAEALDVTSKTGGVALDDKTSDELFTFQELLDLVQDTREITDLAYLRSGVARRASGGLGSGFVIGGARADNTNFIVDGFSDYDPRTGGAQVTPNYDAVEEFRVQTAGNTAEYGRLAGGVMNMVLRSGSNRLHGSAFAFFRSSDLGARNYFDTAKSDLFRDQFGATLSGPVVVPHVYRGNDHTFFLLSFESFSQSAGENRFTNVPTALERSGDFSRSIDSFGLPVTVNDPFTGAPFPRKQIPPDRFSPAARRLIAYYPLPNLDDPFTNFQANQDNRARFHSIIAKFDEHANDNNTFSFRFVTRLNANRSAYTGSDIGAFPGTSDNRPTLAGFSYTRIVTSSLVNEFRVGLARTSDHEGSQYAGIDVSSQLGLPSLISDPRLFGFPRFTVLNLAALGDAPSRPLDFTINNYQLADLVSWTRRRHLLKFGADALRTQFYQQLYNNVRGSYNFLGRATGVAFADLLLGLPDSTSRQSSSSPAYLTDLEIGTFFQDEYSISSRLTLNYGLRYEIKRPPSEKYGRMSSFVPELGQVVIADGRTIPDLAQRIAAAGLTGRVTTASQAGVPKALAYANNHDLAPRFGFAFRPFAKPDTVIRGGYGIYYADSLLDPIRNDLTNVYPFTVSQTFNRVAARPMALSLADPFPAALATLAGVTNVNGFSLHPRPQYLQSYTISAERQLDAATTLEIDYAGSRGTHLAQRFDLNQPYRTLALRLPNGSFPRPFNAFGTINFYSFGANSVYNEGSLSLRRRYRGGLFFGVSYVYSKSLDNASQVSGNSAGDYPGAQNSRNLAAERGRSDWDTGHSLLLFGTYTLPFKGRLARGWQISTTSRFYTGQPFTPRVANANLNLGEANRPNRTGKGSLANPNIDQWFDLQAFPVVSRNAFAFGNSGRNILDGPGYVSVNAALLKNFRLADRWRTQIRCEAVNLPNRANFGLPVDYVDLSSAGRILAADTGRIIQFGLRFQF